MKLYEELIESNEFQAEKSFNSQITIEEYRNGNIFGKQVPFQSESFIITERGDITSFQSALNCKNKNPFSLHTEFNPVNNLICPIKYVN